MDHQPHSYSLSCQSVQSSWRTYQFQHSANHIFFSNKEVTERILNYKNIFLAIGDPSLGLSDNGGCFFFNFPSSLLQQ